MAYLDALRDGTGDLRQELGLRLGTPVDVAASIDSFSEFTEDVGAENDSIEPIGPIGKFRFRGRIVAVAMTGEELVFQADDVVFSIDVAMLPSDHLVVPVGTRVSFIGEGFGFSPPSKRR